MPPDEGVKAAIKSEKHESGNSNNEDSSLPLHRKLLLNAAMMGNEMCVAFQQLYEVPLLQILGVPVTYVSLYPIVTGPTAMLLMSLQGYFCDRGPHHRQKKIAMLTCNCAVVLFGIAVLVCANLLLLYNHEKKNVTIVPEYLYNHSLLMPTSVTPKLITPAENSSVDDSDIKPLKRNLDIAVSSYDENVSIAVPQEQQEDDDAGLLAMTAILGLVGFSAMDIGYDINTAATRSCVLSCSPKTDHTSMLVLALVMAAAGGLINNVFGLVDLSHLFDFGGGSLAMQTSVQLALCAVVLVVSLISTTVTALLSIRRMDKVNNIDNQFTPLTESSSSAGNNRYGTVDHSAKGICSTADVHDGDDHAAEDLSLTRHRSNCPYLLLDDNSDAGIRGRKRRIIRTHKADKSIDDEDGLGEGEAIYQVSKRDEDQMQTPNLSDTCYSISQKQLVGEEQSGQEIDYGNTGDRSDLILQANDSQPRRQKCCRLESHKLNFVFLCLTTFLAVSSVFPYNMYASDFLGIAVMGGDSSAPEGSAERKAYEDGVSVAAGGLLLFFSSYMAVNVVQSKILAVLGLKVEFVLANALMATSILSLTLSKHVAAYYVTSVIYGFQRSALFTVPFIVAKNYIQEQGLEKDGGSAVGKVMAAVTSMVPLNYCTIFVISGPLITATGYEGMPLVLAAVSTYLAAFLFLLHGRF